MPQAREEAGAPKHPIRANGKFWGKFMLNRVPGQVPKECLDEYLAPGRANRRSKRPLDVQMGGAYGPWISRVLAARTNHSDDSMESARA